MAPNKFNSERFSRVMSNLTSEAKRELREALGRAADVITDTQRAYAPVDDGTLQASIRQEPVSEDAGKIAVVIKAGGASTTRPVRNGQSITYDYALGVEFGTKDTPAQPFFFPGYRVNKRRVRSRISRAIKKAVRSSAGAA